MGIMKQILWIFVGYIGTLYLLNLPFEIMYGKDFHKNCDWCIIVIYFGGTFAFALIVGNFYVDIKKFIEESEKVDNKSIKRGWCFSCDKAVNYIVEDYGNSDYGHITCPECKTTIKNASLGNRRYGRHFDKDKDL